MMLGRWALRWKRTVPAALGDTQRQVHPLLSELLETGVVVQLLLDLFQLATLDELSGTLAR